MNIIEKCPECGCNDIGKGKWDGYSVLRPTDKMLSMGSKVFVEVCTNCGLILALRVEKPEKFKKR